MTALVLACAYRTPFRTDAPHTHQKLPLPQNPAVLVSGYSGGKG
jgi:hypothetical protein